MKNATFQNREKALEQICTETGQAILLNIYGESGIGKSSLLLEAARRLQAKDSSSLVLYVDFREISTGQPEALLRNLIAQIQGRLNVTGRDVDQVAGQTVIQLSRLAEYIPTYLMFDTTEQLQEEMGFWRWMETHLVGPLVIEGRVQQIFAGRVPVPWRRVEIRRIVKLLQLEPLSIERDARNLVQEVLQENNPNLKHVGKDQEKLEQAVDLVLEFSFGHPFLSKKLAAYVALRWPLVVSLDEFKINLCRDVIKPFIESVFFKDVLYPWDEILWWISALDWFDATILQRYLKLVASALIEDKPDYFFIQGISRLRIHHTVVWREERGDCLHGVVGKIVRYCLEVLDPERYYQAVRAAANIMETLAHEFPEEYPEFQQYRREAEAYRQRAKKEGEP